MNTKVFALVALLLIATPGDLRSTTPDFEQQQSAGVKLDRPTLAQLERSLPKLRQQADPVTALRVLNTLAAGYGDFGEYELAIGYAREALTLAQQSQLQFYEATARNNLGRLATERGAYDEARQQLEGALRLYEEIASDARTPQHRAVALNNLALLEMALGRPDAASDVLEKVVAAYRSLGGDDRAVKQLLGVALSNLSQTQAAHRRYGEAASNAALGRELAREVGDRIGEGIASNNEGVALNRAGRYEEAAEVLGRALTLRQDIGDSRGVAVTRNNLGFALSRLKRFDEAQRHYELALEFFESSARTDALSVIEILINLASVLDAQGKRVEAEPTYERAIRSLKERLSYHAQFLSEREQLAFLETTSHAFEVFFSFCVRHQQSQPELLDKMYDVLLWQKGFVVVNEASRRARVGTGGAEAVALFDQAMGKRAALSSLERQRPANLGVQEWQARLKTLEGEILGLDRQLQQKVRSADDVVPSDMDWRAVQRGLNPGDAAIEFAHFRYHDGTRMVGSDRYVGLIITPGSAHPQFVELGNAETIERALRDQEALVGLTEAKGVSDQGKAAAAALWQPLAPAIRATKRVYLSPDAGLHKMSWGLLPATDGRRVFETHDVRVVLSTKDILRGADNSTSRQAVVVANPNFDVVGNESPTSPAAAATPASRVTPVLDKTRGACPVRWQELTNTAIEAQKITALLRDKGWSVTSMLGAEAAEPSVKRVSQPRVLHMATHGCFLETEPDDPSEPSRFHDPMLQSFLVLAGANRTTDSKIPVGSDDGVLTAYEASALKLQGTELVVLSACQTGLGRVKNGEGVFGLGRALQVAGARAVLMSLWSVPDEETQILMTSFYEHWLAGADKHTALRRAQSEVRAKVRARHGVDLPFYWAAFVLVGS